MIKKIFKVSIIRPQYSRQNQRYLVIQPCLAVDFASPNQHAEDEIFKAERPVILRNYVAKWPAIQDSTKRWSNIDSLFSRVQGKYHVPVEIGGSYMNVNAQIVETEFGSFLEYIKSLQQNDSHKTMNSSLHVYLAQCDLNSMPTLLEDVTTPTIATTTGKKTLYRRNLWFNGPAGAHSPCHYDPFHNILCQILGQKRILLFHPEESRNLYPASGTVQKNTSMIDFQKLDESKHKYPGLNSAKGYEAILNSGDSLFIPLKWWHYCESFETSCSINYWWL